MHNPEERDQKRSGRPGRVAFLIHFSPTKRSKKFPEQKIKENTARHMEQNVGEMKSVGVALPKQVIHHKGKTLDGPVMRREQVQKKIMPEDFENKDRAPDQGIVVHEGDVVPDHLALQRGHSDNKTDDNEEQTAHPIF